MGHYQQIVRPWSKKFLISSSFDAIKTGRIVSAIDRLYETNAGRLFLSRIGNIKIEFNPEQDNATNVGGVITLNDDNFSLLSLTTNVSGRANIFEQTFIHELAHSALMGGFLRNPYQDTLLSLGTFLSSAADRKNVSSSVLAYVTENIRNTTGREENTEELAQRVLKYAFGINEDSNYFVFFPVTSGTNVYDYTAAVPQATQSQLNEIKSYLDAKGGPGKQSSAFEVQQAIKVTLQRALDAGLIAANQYEWYLSRFSRKGSAPGDKGPYNATVTIPSFDSDGNILVEYIYRRDGDETVVQGTREFLYNLESDGRKKKDNNGNYYPPIGEILTQDGLAVRGFVA